MAIKSLRQEINEWETMRKRNIVKENNKETRIKSDNNRRWYSKIKMQSWVESNKLREQEKKLLA